MKYTKSAKKRKPGQKTANTHEAAFKSPALIGLR